MNKNIPSKYVPKSLTPKQRKKQIESIEKGVDRPKLEGIRTRRSKYTVMADKYFDGNTSVSNISKKLGVNRRGLDEIIKKGEGAYYTSGSRPNVTARQWGYVRMFSVLFGGKARDVDKDIVEKYKIPLLK